jgi:hypothetical protein
MKYLNSNQRREEIIGKIKKEFGDFVSQAKDWALVPRFTVRPDDQNLVWVPFTSLETQSIITTSIILYLNGLVSFSIIDDYKDLSVARERYVGEDSYKGLRIDLTIVKDGREFNISEFYEF